MPVTKAGSGGGEVEMAWEVDPRTLHRNAKACEAVHRSRFRAGGYIPVSSVH